MPTDGHPVQRTEAPPMLVRPAKPSEYDAVIEMVARRFDPGDSAPNVVDATLRYDPRFRPQHLRIVESEGQLAGMMLFIDRMVRIGAAKVHCGIVAPVATDRHFERRGVASLVMRDALDWATREGYHLSMLWGHTWLYPRYGYAPGLKSYDVVLPAHLSPTGDAGYTIRPATAADAPVLAVCYHISTAFTTLAEIRTDEPWEWRPRDERQFVEVAVDPVRSVRGYFRAARGAGRLEVREIAAMDDGAAQALFDRLLVLAREMGDVETHVTATPDNRWSRWAFLHGAAFRIDGGGGHGMVRVLDLDGFFKSIRPELERRVATSEYVAKRAGLRLETPLGTIGLLVDNGRVRLSEGRGERLVTLPWAAFGSLVTGYRPAESLVGQPGVRIEGDTTLRLLQVLFPEGYPHWPIAAYF
jgi:predicted N-acetyltransferase YhbS